MNIITRNEFINACKSVYPDCKFTNGYGHILNTLNDPDTNEISACLTDHISINENFAFWIKPDLTGYDSNVRVWYGANKTDKHAEPANYDELVSMLEEHKSEVYGWFGEVPPKAEPLQTERPDNPPKVEDEPLPKKVHKTRNRTPEYTADQLESIIGNVGVHITRHLDATYDLVHGVLSNTEKRNVIPSIVINMRGNYYDLVYRTERYLVVQVRCGVYRIYNASLAMSYKKTWECWLMQTLMVVRDNIVHHRWFPIEPKSAPTYEDTLKSLSNEELIKECLNWYKRVEDNA